ncbi:MAG: hypothetical protein KatS3mg113_1108 [Planctomycetaceae bacterium]|nr:MAG: hypothetical protein KatS3mg113_1108 [Planctomycetaceae bacterium]
MKRSLIGGWLFLLSAHSILADETAQSPHDWLTRHPTITRLVQLANQHRAQYGLPALKINPEMCLAAQRHAEWMASYQVLQHSGLPWPEIIFLGPTQPEAAIQGWIYSPAHHAILLSGTEVGFGFMVYHGQPAWVGVFR